MNNFFFLSCLAIFVFAFGGGHLFAKGPSMSKKPVQRWFVSLPFLICIFFVLVFVALFFTVTIPETRSVQITFAWARNSEPDLCCYRIYRTTTAGCYTFFNDDPYNNDLVWEGTENTAIVTVDEACWFVITAVDSAGNESDPSDEVSYQAPDGFSNGEEAPDDITQPADDESDDGAGGCFVSLVA
jgi:uncharacterized membrane protein